MRKKNKLYTVNKFNRSMFMPKENLFWLGGQEGNYAKLDADKLQLAQSQANNSALLSSMAKGGAGAGAGLLGALKGPVGGSLISSAAGAIGGLAGNAIAGGLESGAGSAISGIGSTVGSAIGAVNPVAGAIVSVGSQVLGGLTSRAFGTKTNEKLLKEVNEGIKKNNSFVSNASSFDEIKGPEAVVTNTDVYSGGWFSGGKADEKNEELKQRMIAARSFANRSVDNNVNNLIDDQMNNALANFSAFGGPLEMTDNNTYDMGGVLDYDLASRYLTLKEKQAEQKNKMANMFAGMPESMFAFGGDMQTNYGDYPTGLTHIDAGGSHEENINDGVQMGVDNEGTPNLVEEGETVYNDYVFSNRILADEATKKLFHLPKKREITYAEISKKLEKEIAERPNDVISKAGFKAQMQTLEEQQERQKQEMEAERAKAAFEALSPEEQQAVMQQVAQQQAVAEQAAMQQPSPEEMQMMQQQQAMQADGSQAMVGQEPPMMAEGGKLFEKGGSTKKNAGIWKSGDSSSNWSAYTKNGLRDYLLMINDELAEAETEEDKKKIREKAIKTVNNIQKAYSEAYQADLTPSEKSDKVEALQKAFQEAGGNAYFSGIANNINMPKGHNTADTEEKGWVDGYWGPRTSIRNWGSTEYGDADYYKDIADLAAEAGLSYAPGEYKYGDNTLYQLGIAEEPTTNEETAFLPDPYEEGWEERRGTSTTPAVATKTPEEEGPGIEPVKKADWMRYAGLFGPAVGLGMQMAGIGRPDYSTLDAAVSGAGNAHLATYKPLGNYLTYRPMDIWYEQNALNAQSRATNRTLANSTSPSKMAGLIANGYNSQLASGDLYRKALEYNDAKRAQVAEFNRGTDQFNAEAFNRLSQFNASALNDAESRNVNARLHAAQQKLAGDAGWYNSLYGNVSGLFKGISDIGRENRETNWRNALVTAGAFGAMDDDALVKAGIAKYKKGNKSSEGGTVKRKKGRRGLTY